MIAYLLDTSTIIDYLRGKQLVVDMLNNAEGELHSSYVCLAELYEGVHRVTNFAEVEKGVNKFFASLSFIYGLDSQIARKFGEIRAQLKRKGQVIEDLDLILASTCLVHDLMLVTSNKKHFSRVPNLQIYRGLLNR